MEWVTQDRIQQLFNKGHYHDRVQSGELVAFPKSRSHTAPPSEPRCTWSEIIVYYTRELDPIAMVHQYSRPDGTIGASGLPDPKCLWLEDKMVKSRFERPK